MDSLIGKRLGQYQITGVLGRGGMATVYRATQERLGRDVAVKVLRASLDPQAAARFEREARAVAGLSHPNILPVYDYGEEGGVRYIVAQYIEGGRSLASRLADGPLPQAEAVALVAPVLDALAYAHGRGVIHRDIKPANILLPRPDWPLLGDFGIAQSLSEQTQLTSPGEIIGTPSYMAPERATGQASDARADLYAVGVVLYELLTGREPFTGDSPLAVLMQHVRDQPRPPSELNPGVSPALEHVTLRALEKEPGRRYQSATEMAAALREAARAPGSVSLGPWPDDRPPSVTPAPAPTPRPAPPPAPRPRSDSFAPVPLPEPAPLQPPRPRRLGWPVLLAAGALAVALIFGLLRAGGRLDQGPADLPITLEDDAWGGGFRGPFGGGPTYGGRTPVVAYGEGSGASEIQARFTLAAAPPRAASLTLEGMDSEGPARTELVIALNGQTIYNGPNPLPDDDYVLETGPWARHSFPFDPAILRVGENVVTIFNRSQGNFAEPPFIIIDYAIVE